MTYFHHNTTLKVRIQETPQGMAKFVGKLMFFTATISDDLIQTDSRQFGLNIKLLDPEPKASEIQVISKTLLQQTIIGKIDFISVFGEVDISLNNTQFEPRQDVRLSEVNSSVIDIYVIPTYNWTDWYGTGESRLNFTWTLVELTRAKMRIKMNFTDPTAVSPFIRYDKLLIHLPEVTTLFKPV